MSVNETNDKAKKASSKGDDITLDNLKSHLDPGAVKHHSPTQQATGNNTINPGLAGGIESILGINLRPGQNLATKLAKDFTELLDKQNADLKRAGIDSKVYNISSESRDPNSSMAFDIVAMVFSKSNVAVTYSFMLTQSRDIGDFETLFVNTGADNFNISRVPSDAYDDVYVKILQEKVSNIYGGSLDKVIVKEPRILLRGFEDTEENIALEFSNAIVISLQDLLESLGETTDITIDSIRSSGKTNLMYNASMPPANEITFDSNGMPVSTRMVGSLTIHNNTKRSIHDSMNTQAGSITIGNIAVRAGAVYAPIKAPQSGINIQDNTNPQAFSPHVIITDLSMPNPSFGRFLLTLTASAAMLDKAVIKRLLVPESIGVLNVECNLLNKEKPLPMSPDAVLADYDNIYDAMFNQNGILALLVKPGTPQYTINGIFLAAHTNAAANEYLFDKINAFTNGAFAKHFNKGDRMVASIEKYALGTYTDKAGNERPVDEIDLLYVMNAVPKQENIIKQWVMSQANGVDPSVALEQKKAIMQTVTHNKCVFHDTQELVNLSSNFIQALVMSLHESGVPIQSNTYNFSSMEQQGWNAYTAASYGVDMSSWAGGHGLFVPLGANNPQQNATGFGNNGFWGWNQPR